MLMDLIMALLYADYGICEYPEQHDLLTNENAKPNNTFIPKEPELQGIHVLISLTTGVIKVLICPSDSKPIHNNRKSLGTE